MQKVAFKISDNSIQAEFELYGTECIFLPKLSELIQNGPILAVLQLFQYFPTEVRPNLFRMANFNCLAIFLIFSYQSGPNLFGMANFGCFATFPIFF